MLHVVTAGLYADLEATLADQLRSCRARTPFGPLTIAVPSDHVRQRLQWALCIEHELSLCQVHILTFYQLALRLIQEQEGEEFPAFRSERFFREWIHLILKRRQASLPAFSRLIDVPGAWAALWSTIKDLKDGAVDASIAKHVIAELGQGPDPVSESVLSLYNWYCQEREHIRAFDMDDAAKLACPGVKSSSFLSQQEHIWYYGFYDLTQVQLDLFHAIAQRYPTTILFPLVQDHPAYTFAQQFFDRHIVGLCSGAVQFQKGKRRPSGLSLLFAASDGRGEGENLSFPENGPPESGDWVHGDLLNQEGTENPLSEQSNPDLRIIQVATAADEIGWVAKDILRVVEEHGVGWHEIGVVGRTLAPYQDMVPRVFHGHGIPFNTTIQRPLVEWPYVQTLLGLLKIPLLNFYRGQVMDVVTSPHFRLESVEDSENSMENPLPELWDCASRRYGITNGMEEWERFFRVLSHVPLATTEASSAWHKGVLTRKQAALCQETLTGLFESLNQMPSCASYKEFVGRVETLQWQFLVGQIEKTDKKESCPLVWQFQEPSSYRGPQIDHVEEAIREQLEEIQCLDHVSEGVTFPEFVDTFERWMQATSLPLHGSSLRTDGVWVLDAMAARGYSFRVVYVVGVNEHVFPRHIQEDAFLRDSVRRALSVTAGCKIQEKSEGYQEEQLLFYLLVNAASEKLTLLSPRDPENDRAAIPSWYLSEVQRCCPHVPMVILPKGGRKAMCEGETSGGEKLLTPQEMRLQWISRHPLPQQPLSIDEMGWAIVKRGLGMVAHQESSSPQLTAYDGMIQSLGEWWKELEVRGISPTMLESYADCPFKFFAKHVLRIERNDEVPLGYGLGPRERGNLLHRLLKECGESITKGKSLHPAASLSPENIREQVARVAHRVYRQYEQDDPTGYPVVWDVLQELLVQVVGQVLEEDLCSPEEDWMPSAFEKSIHGEVRVVLEEGPVSLPLVGRIDRMDWSDSRGQIRIVDYKYKQSSRSIPRLSVLCRDIVRGIQLQPPLYLTVVGQEGGRMNLANQEEQRVSPDCAGVLLYYLTMDTKNTNKVCERVVFTREQWQILQPQVKKTLAILLGGIQRGEFFVAPGNQCQRCEFRVICHRTHPQSRWRAAADRMLTQAYRTVRLAQPVV